MGKDGDGGKLEVRLPAEVMERYRRLAEFSGESLSGWARAAMARRYRDEAMAMERRTAVADFEKQMRTIRMQQAGGELRAAAAGAMDVEEVPMGKT